MAAKNEEKKKPPVRRLMKSVNPKEKEEMSKSSTQKTKIRKRPSVASQEKISTETEAAVADFVEYHTNLDRNLFEQKQLVNAVIAGAQEHQRCCQVKERNRYQEVPCLDVTRVVLNQDTPAGCDFIHANKCKFELVDKQYIIAQAPMKNTFEDFWRMIFQESSATIVVLCDFYEDGKEKADSFWPMTTGQFQYHGKMFINNKKTEAGQGGEEPDTYVVEVLPDGCSNSLIATLYYAKWPFGLVPGPGLIQLLRSMKTAGKDGPITVVSSQGIGRAPAFTAVDITMTRLFKGQKTRLLEVATEIRKQRALSFEDTLHYMFTVQASLKYLRAKVKKHGDAVKKYLESIVALKTDPV